VGSLTVHVIGSGGRPAKGKKVFCNYPHANLFGTHSTEYTDDNGMAQFADVPVGKVEVMVDGRTRVTIDVGRNDHKDVTVAL
jgi:hypothetical protein